MKSLKILMTMAVVVICLTACRSSRHASRHAETEDIPVLTNPSLVAGKDDTSRKDKKNKKKNKAEVPQTKGAGINVLTSKMNLTLETGGNKINVGGTYRLKRDEVVQINLTYTMLFTISVGTMELTPDYLLFIDRLNKRYCKAAYSDIPAFAEAGVDFNYLQRIFWGEAESSPTPALEWNYANWTPIGGGQFPGQILFTLRNGNAAYKANFNLSNLREDDDWEKRTEVSEKYTPISFDVAMRAILNLVK